MKAIIEENISCVSKCAVDENKKLIELRMWDRRNFS